MLSNLLTILHYAKRMARHKFTYFVVFMLFLVHVSDSFSARLREQPAYIDTEVATDLRVEADRVVLDPVSRKGADLAVTSSDPEEEMSKAISGLDIVTFAMSLKGKPYKWAGVSPKTGFDCSGYTYFVFKELGVDIARSSRAQYKEGIEVDETEARKGDLIFFRGTNPASKQIGHVGIVISEPGEETVRFVHSSTGRGVVEDSLERTNYRRRYIGVKRVL